MDIDHQAALDEYLGSDSDDDDGVNRMIVTAAGLDAGLGQYQERQVLLGNSEFNLTSTLQCTRWSTSTQETSEHVSSKVDLRHAMYSLVNSLNQFALHSQNCKICEQHTKGWILDSGASVHFTPTKSDFIQYEEVKDGPTVKTAAAPLQIKGQGTVLLDHYVERNGQRIVKTTRIYPVCFVPGMSIRLLSMGLFLNNKQEVRGTSKSLSFSDLVSHQRLLSAYPLQPLDTIFWVVPPEPALIAKISTIYMVDYDVWHKRFGHPSKDVLRHAKELKNFPGDLPFPEHSPLCRGCAEGKLHSKSFPESDSRARRPFDLVHSDLKEFPILSYSKYKFFVSFLDDCSSHAWVVLLRKKSDTLKVFKHFIAMIKTQFNATLKELMTDYGGEYKSKDFDDLLK
jgi:hypothetical protein